MSTRVEISLWWAISRPGLPTFKSAGTVHARLINYRTVLCHRVIVEETLTHSRVVCLGDARVGYMLGGSVIAAADIEVLDGVGDGNHVPSELWAGHHAPNAARLTIAKLNERRLHAERGRMVSERERTKHQIDDMTYKEHMYSMGGYMRQDYMDALRQRLVVMRSRSEEIETDLEEARSDILSTRSSVDDLESEIDDRSAQVAIRGRVFGVTVRVADRMPQVIDTSVQSVITRG